MIVLNGMEQTGGAILGGGATAVTAVGVCDIDMVDDESASTIKHVRRGNRQLRLQNSIG